MTTLFLEPLDVLVLRGNKLFGDPGSFGEALIPPWPSVAAGAIRSRMLADAGIDIAAFASGQAGHDGVGTRDEPGPFSLTAFHVARRLAGQENVEILVAPPADLVIGKDGERVIVNRLQPQALHEALHASNPLPQVAVLAEATRSKPEGGYWLTEAGWRKYLQGKTPDAADLVKSSQLWVFDQRVGVGLDAGKRSAAEGRLFTVQAVAMREGVGFLAAIAGANPPQSGTVRLGGDGRAAAIRAIDHTLPEPDYATIAQKRRCRFVLTTPGLFAEGWLPTGVQSIAGDRRFELGGVKGRLVCAAVPRFEVVSGWDLARWTPKPAQRAAPAGSVYWLDELDATPEALRKLVERGLWSDPCEDAARRAEGFNRLALAVWN